MFSENLIRILKERKLSQKQLAQMVGVSEQAVSHWCHGSVPTMRHMDRLCDALNCDLRALTSPKEEEVDYLIKSVCNRLTDAQKDELLRYAIYLLKE